MANVVALANELRLAYGERRTNVAPPSGRDGGLSLDDAYVVEHELTRQRRSEGQRTVGVKVGFANKAMWRVLKLDTLVWAHMYDDTVRYAAQADSAGAGPAEAWLSLDRMVQPKIEPEIVFKLKHAPPADNTDPVVVLESVEWLALGFEIIDCVYDKWTFQPADFVAAYGLHAALVVGAPLAVGTDNIPSLVEGLPRFTVALARNGEPVEQGSGRNSLRSPALCLAELATAMSRRPGAEPLAAGDLVSSGTLTESRLIAPGETWTATVVGLPVSNLTLRTT